MFEEEAALGITLPLSTEVADRLRNYAPAATQDEQQLQLLQQKNPPKLSFLRKKSAADVDSDDDDDEYEYENAGEFDGNYPGGRRPLPDVDPLDDWTDVLAAVPIEAETAGLEKTEADDDDEAENKDEENNKNSDDENDDDDDDVSLSPAPNMPVVLIDLKRLVGHVPTSPDEIEQLEHQIHAALWYGSSETPASKSGGNPQEDHNSIKRTLVAAQHFDERVTELMDSGVARHATTTLATTGSSSDEETNRGNSNGKNNEQQKEATPRQHLQIAYPEYLCSPSNNNKNADTNDNADDTIIGCNPRQVMATAHIWKRLLRAHSIPVVDSLLRYLRTCHRSLVWKHAMHRELWDLARSEELLRTRRHQSKALCEWKTVERANQLEQLYQVRETLEHRWEMAKEKIQGLKAVRDKAVAQEIRRRRYESGGTMNSGAVGGLEAFDLNATVLAFPDDNDTTWLGLEDDDDDGYGGDDQIGPSFGSDSDNKYSGGESDGSGYDAGGDAEEDAHAHKDKPPPAIDGADNDDDDDDDALPKQLATMPARPKRDTKSRREALAKRRRRRLQEAAKEAEHATKLDQARSEELRMRELFTSNDLKMSQAIAAAVKQKLDRVDELLESLQEETWEDEEAEENGDALIPTSPGDDDDDHTMAVATSEDEFTLLDQILAMILGAFPPPTPSSGEDEASLVVKHTQRLQKEHARIIKGWRAHFGRLPSLLKPEPSAKKQPSQDKLRSSYGIVENEEDDWDNDNSDDGNNNNNNSSEGPANQLPTASVEAEQPPALSTPIAAPAPAPPLPARVGLRPGGRI